MVDQGSLYALPVDTTVGTANVENPDLPALALLCEPPS